MKNVRIQKKRFLIPFSYTMGAIFILSISIAVINAGPNSQSNPLENISMALLLLTYFVSIIITPVLGIRFFYNICLLISTGRKTNIKVFCAQNLFNPLNFLILPSLLNRPGLVYRRRCIVSLILFTVLIALINYLLTLRNEDIHISGDSLTINLWMCCNLISGNFTV